MSCVFYVVKPRTGIIVYEFTTPKTRLIKSIINGLGAKLKYLVGGGSCVYLGVISNLPTLPNSVRERFKQPSKAAKKKDEKK